MNTTSVSLLHYESTPNVSHATVKIFPDVRSEYAVPAFITGKFCEHLGSNVYNGMCAQILRNPTFANYPFFTGEMTADGCAAFHCERAKISEAMCSIALQIGWSEESAQQAAVDHSKGLAAWWLRIGESRISPDTSRHGGRAQRVECTSAGQGIRQLVWLPLHRVHEYKLTLVVRSRQLTTLRVSLKAGEHEQAGESVLMTEVGTKWTTLHATFKLPKDSPTDVLYTLDIVAEHEGSFVIERAILYPADHIDGADPDVIRLLKDSHLPLLRWPGGNFVSAYHWFDGVGPVNERPTRPNLAWGSVEPNLFGTQEFILFCRAVGCEPMICINAGDGTPEEAAAWIEYCNGSADSTMCRLRAQDGYPEPFNVKYWEVGNEIWGAWQLHWTTPEGYADRHEFFARTMKQADPSIQLMACGAPMLWGPEWNATLVKQSPTHLRCITDHPLIGGNVALSTDPLDVHRDFMGIPDVLQRRWLKLRETMIQGGIDEPRLAITELQEFAHLSDNDGTDTSINLTRRTLVNPASLSEALYNILIYHNALRIAPFVEMITHSATVNHGGGLRKERERVYANPCHYAQSAFAVLAGATPVAVDLRAASMQMPVVLPELKNADEGGCYSAVDAFAAVAEKGDLLISLVNRGGAGAVELEVKVEGMKDKVQAVISILASEHPWDQNSLDMPDKIVPRNDIIPIKEGGFKLLLPDFSFSLIKI